MRRDPERIQHPIITKFPKANSKCFRCTYISHKISLKNHPGTTSDLAGGPLCGTEAPSPFIFSPRLPGETKPILSDRLAFIKILGSFCNPHCRKHVNSVFRLRFMSYVYAHYITCVDHKQVKNLKSGEVEGLA